MALLFLLIFSLAFLGFGQTNYYVDADADDGGDGTTQATTGEHCAWNEFSDITGLSAGDTVSFERTDEFRGKLSISWTGSVGSIITFDAYGSGAKPKLLGSIAKDSTDDWTDEGSNIWYASSATQIDNLIFDGESSEATMVADKVDLNVQGEGWWDAGNTRIYVYSVGNPATFYSGDIECALYDYGIQINKKSYLTFENLDIRYAGRAGVKGVAADPGYSNITVVSCDFSYLGNNLSAEGTGIDIHSIDDCVLENCTFDVVYTGIKLSNVNLTTMSTLVQDNTITNLRGYTGGCDGMNLGDGDQDGTIIQRNDISGFEDDGIDMYTADNIIVQDNEIHDGLGTGENNALKMAAGITGEGHIIRRNFIYNCTGGSGNHGIRGDHTKNCEIYLNLVYNVDGSGYKAADREADGVRTGSVVKNNVFYGCGRGISGGDGIDGENKLTITLKNNICQGSTKDISFADDCVITGGNNCLLNDASVTLGADSTYSGAANDLYQVDPLLTDPASGDFTLQFGSPCINKGAHVGLFTDYLGNPVPIGHTPDIGVYEHKNGGRIF